MPRTSATVSRQARPRGKGARWRGKGKFYRPAGGFFLWLDVGDGEAAAVRLWRDAAIRVLPGAYLGRPTPTGSIPARFIRLALVHDNAIWARARPRRPTATCGRPLNPMPASAARACRAPCRSAPYLALRRLHADRAEEFVRRRLTELGGLGRSRWRCRWSARWRPSTRAIRPGTMPGRRLVAWRTRNLLGLLGSLFLRYLHPDAGAGRLSAAGWRSPPGARALLRHRASICRCGRGCSSCFRP
jgi:hypothetical protein